MGRRGMYFALDCQSANEVKGLVQGSEDYLLMFKTTSFKDKQEMCDELKRERRMRNDQVGDLAFLEKGECYVAETGRVVKKIRLILPRTLYWKKEYPNFYKGLWDNYDGEWGNIEATKDTIDEIYDNNKDDYKPKEKESKESKVNTKEVEVTQLPPQIKTPMYEGDVYPI